MRRTPTSIRLSDEGWEILHQLMRYHGLKVTGTIEYALRVAAREAGLLPAAGTSTAAAPADQNVKE